MDTVTILPTLMWQKLTARLMLAVLGYMIIADTVLISIIAMLLFLFKTLVVEALSINPLVNKVFLYICTSKQLNNIIRMQMYSPSIYVFSILGD